MNTHGIGIALIVMGALARSAGICHLWVICPATLNGSWATRG